MKRTLLATAIGLGLTATSVTAQAGLATGTLLTLEPGMATTIEVPIIDPATGEPIIDPATGEPAIDPATGEIYTNTVPGPFQGSSFSMGASRVPLNPGSDGGIIMGQIQLGSGAHGGPPNGTENDPIDAAWLFFCNTGFHYTTTAITVLDNDVNNDGGFTQSLDMSGWTVGWSGIPEINIGGVGTITCSLADCAAGSTYALDYATPIPSSTLHNFGGVSYKLELRGVVSAVPVPAAVWLFGSGLVGLVGVARRKKSLHKISS